ncbi:VQ motif-containing protein 4-like [Gastrolobium bilobum]|uniref:VQ motif-containing protein 4-like n=1 Tax=Gastrolobium bilobum TaxID=150636 RepID=UPI002AAF3688|nr:VQ motif-containing protein 4-like [Gastrolobium bilobum]
MDSNTISPRRYQQNHHQHQHHPTTTLLPSPRHSHNNSSSSSNSSNGHHHHHNPSQQLPPLTPTTPTPTPSSYPPKPITRSESANPYPTTFVQADTSSFKQVVQMLTGTTETAKQACSAYSAAITKPTSETKTHIPPIKTTIPKKPHQSGFKLYERRNSLKNLNINPLLPVFSSNNASGFSPRKPEVLSPSILDFPSLVLSPVTPLIPDPFDRSGTAPSGYSAIGSPILDTEAEERAIKEKSFFFHPSPATTPRDSEPRLLPLFPITSPRASGSSSSS